MGHAIAQDERDEMAAGHGKIILFGEHAVVYGSRAIAAPVPLAVRARVVDEDDGVWLVIPRWGVEQRLRSDPAKQMSFEVPAALILRELGLTDRSMRIEVFSEIPRAMGLGGSAAVAVAIIRALDRHFALGLSDDQVNALAFQCECVAHGTPSGIDNTVATFGKPLVYRKGDPPEIRPARSSRTHHLRHRNDRGRGPDRQDGGPGPRRPATATGMSTTPCSRGSTR